MKYLPPLNCIRSFEASARHLSFTRAAEELRMTQAAVSGHVRALEQFIGRPLFFRAPRSLTLTEVGTAYLPAVQRALSQLDQATGLVQTVRHRKEVVIACPASLATNWLPLRLKFFREQYPDVEITVHATIWAETPDHVVDLRITPRHVSQPLVGQSLGEERLAMVCRPDFLTGPDAITTPSEVQRKGLIHIIGRQEFWDAFAGYHGILDMPLVQGLTADSSNVALEMAILGLGCAITLASLTDIHLKRGSLVEPFPANISSGWGFDLCPGELPPTRASEKLKSLLLSSARG
ncbi:MAG: LysR substrate-binding domain-containing protein [Aestuariivirga sp.]|uniref:LysR substrate-binding domain-containing protein n=1 Tax=Aestuariivirga sp. TaxID=2650926 RepID=UPI0038CFBE2C